MNLMPQQNDALEKQLQNKVGALFMKMGTGKTRVAVELVNSVNDLELVIWIGPLRSINPIEKSLPSIKDEISKWGGFKCENVIFMGVETIGLSDINYSIILNKAKKGLKTFLVVDESIKIKNYEAIRTQRLLELSKWCEFKLILNGEPITNNILDLYTQVHFLDQSILNMDLAEFKNTFCKYTTVTKRTGNYKTYSKEFITGYENIDYLYSLINEYIFECDLELCVSKIFKEVNYSLSAEEIEEYNHFKEKYLDNELMQILNNNIFLEMTQKMQHSYCCSEEKFEKTASWIEDEAKTIIFTKYIASAKECKVRFPKAKVLNYKTGSLSLNLQEFPYTVYFDQTFDWGDVIQSQHRNYRVGIQQDVRYLRLIGNVGLEDLMFNNNKKKLGISEYLKKISKKQLKKIL